MVAAFSRYAALNAALMLVLLLCSAVATDYQGLKLLKLAKEQPGVVALPSGVLYEVLQKCSKFDYI